MPRQQEFPVPPYLISMFPMWYSNLGEKMGASSEAWVSLGTGLMDRTGLTFDNTDGDDTVTPSDLEIPQ